MSLQNILFTLRREPGIFVNLTNRKISQSRIAKAVVEVGGVEAFAKIAKSADKKIYYFTATWCPPCRAIAPVFKTLSEAHKTISFVKVSFTSLSHTHTHFFQHLIAHFPPFPFSPTSANLCPPLPSHPHVQRLISTTTQKLLKSSAFAVYLHSCTSMATRSSQSTLALLSPH